MKPSAVPNLEDDMSDQGQPVIVGAGPVGLGAALFLAREGILPRVVEMREEPSRESKALAVNPRTLDILEPTGVAQQMLEMGMPVHGVHFHRGVKIFASISLEGIPARHNFMLALSQATTERLLATALETAGGHVERGVKMVECRNQADHVEVVLVPTHGGPREKVRCPWLLAADGAHSVARQQLGIDFRGTSFAKEWYLADVPLNTNLAADQAQVFFLAGGAFLFMIRVVDDIRVQPAGAPVWRVITNRPEPLSYLVDAQPVGPVLWTSSFHIAHRINATMAAGNVYFAGDAAHIHSPLGARGMNLGLEDAWVFANLVRANRLSEYDRLRRPVDQRVVRQVELLSRVAAADSQFFRLVRALAFPLALKLPFLRTPILRTVTGVDHPLPDLGVEGASQSPVTGQEAFAAHE